MWLKMHNYLQLYIFKALRTIQMLQYTNLQKTYQLHNNCVLDGTQKPMAMEKNHETPNLLKIVGLVWHRCRVSDQSKFHMSRILRDLPEN